jgi:CRP-like cAMP-binding protein
MSTIERTISSGEVIIREGDEGNTFFQLLEGKVGVYNNYGQEDQV